MRSSTSVPAGPPALGTALGVVAEEDAGGLVRRLSVPPHLHGPEGILQGGLATGLLAEAARLADRFGAPLTSVDARLRRPTPLASELDVRVVPVAAARFDVGIEDAGAALVTGTVELAGHDPTPRVADLVELAGVPFPPAEPQDRFPHCWVCGPDHPDGLALLPRWHAPDALSIPWIPEDRLADGRGRLHPVVVAAVLDCPTFWAACAAVDAAGFAGALLAGMHVRHFRPALVGEPLRVVARFDTADGRRFRARAALVDEDGVVYATSSCLHLGVARLPEGAPR
jgi:acyl-coenzyme A thioesterase PaaI-like protein